MVIRILIGAALMALSLSLAVSGIPGWHALWAPLAVAAALAVAPLIVGGEA